MKRFLLGKWCLHVVALLITSTLTVHSQQRQGGIFSLGISDDANVQFVWRGNSEPDLAGYKLYVGTTPGIYAGFIDVGNVTTFKASELIRGMTYYFALTAYNTLGLESDPTPELKAQLPLISAPPVPQIVEPFSTNKPPYFESLPDLVLAQGTTNHVVLLLGLHPGAEGELDVLNVSATSSAPELIPNPAVTYANGETNALVTLQPVLGAVGSATITATASDGQSESNNFSRSFNVIIEPLNTPPVIGRIPDLWLFAGRPAEAIPITIVDAETASEGLKVTVRSSNPEVVHPSGLRVTGSGGNHSLSIDSSNGRTGVSIVTVTASDGSASVSTSFAATVLNL